ncbi:KAP family P-loop NTPase fold protein [Sorangium sp. So ce204]|uniref:KAP family P-loop NTPase fold protein n=1 Tax=Sorangium sp. So ce204 TaxID=3133288 RepID=UPI003F635F25
MNAPKETRTGAALLKEIHSVTDHLDRSAALATLNAAIARMPQPACIALYGSWGAGKTTLLRLAENHWHDDKEPIRNRAIWFDPWEHEQRGDVISPLLNAIVTHVARWNNAEDNAGLVDLAARIGKTLLSLAARLGAQELGKRLKIEDLTPDDVTKFFKGWKEFHNDVDRVKERFRTLVQDHALKGAEPGARLVVFLDDLDRCLPESVVNLLEATKLLLCGTRGTPVTFVFGLDRTVVGEAIAKRYPGSSLYTGESYLEKIFDLSLEVPPVQKGLLDAFLDDVLEQAGLAAQLASVGGRPMLEEVFLIPALANPRVIKRSINRLLLLLSSKESAEKTEKQFRTERDRERLLLWLAGAERFRGFRYAFLEASPAEVKAFHAACQGDTAQVRIGDGLRRVIGTPGFLGFYDRLVGERASAETADTERKLSKGEQAMWTIADIDAHLRRYGL